MTTAKSLLLHGISPKMACIHKSRYSLMTFIHATTSYVSQLTRVTGQPVIRVDQ